MVASSPVERTGPGQIDYLLNRIADIERRLDQQGAKSTYPFSIGHGGVRDFSVEPSASGDGTADIFIGNGAGGKLIQIKTDSVYGTKIIVFLDQQGRTMMSTDALAGFGWGTPSYPLPYAGFEVLNLNGATSHALATEIGRGSNFIYNPSWVLQPRIRIAASTAVTVNLYVQTRDGQGNLLDTTERVVNVSAGGTTVQTPNFQGAWQADDMNAECGHFIKAWCSSGVGANVNLTLSFYRGFGASQRFYVDHPENW